MFSAKPSTTKAITLTITVSLFLLTSCATPEKPVIFLEPEAASKNYATIVVPDVQSDASVNIPSELLKRTGERLTTKLSEAGYTMMPTKPGGAEGEYLLLNAKMERYEGGSVFGRWIGFGQGAAVCALKVDIIDGRSGNKVGDVAATQTIKGGGLYSIGAENYIVDRCADSIASGISEKLSKPGKKG